MGEHTTLGDCHPGDRFVLVGCPEVKGAVMRLGLGSCSVRVEGATERVEFEAGDRSVAFERVNSRIQQWSLGTLVLILREEKT